MDLVKLLLSIFLFISAVFSGIADPTPIEIQQPNGEKVILRQTGDEFYHAFETIDGYTVIKDQQKYWTYAVRNSKGELRPSVHRVLPNGIRSGSVADYLKSIGPHLKPSGNRLSDIYRLRDQFNAQLSEVRRQNLISGPIQKDFRLLILLVEFPDLLHVVSKVSIDSIFNFPGFVGPDTFATRPYGPPGGPGCFKEYYTAASNGNFVPKAEIFGWYMDDNSYKYYGDGNSDSQDRCNDLVIRLLKKVDSEINFANYDNNNDGKCDGILVIHAGRGASGGMGDWNAADLIWNFSGPNWLSGQTCDGKQMSSFAILQEIEYYRQAGMGNYVHEFGHDQFGFPDLYGKPTTGQFCVMASSAWCNWGRTPTYFCPYVRNLAKWLNPTVITKSGPYDLPNIEQNYNSVFRCNGYKSSEYFLIENRQKIGWDKFLPGNGLCIYHINPALSGSAVNKMKQADGLYHLDGDVNKGDSADTYPGATNNTSLTNTTNPNSLLSNGSDSYLRVTDIGASAASMKATISIYGGAAVQISATPSKLNAFAGGTDTLIFDNNSATPPFWGNAHYTNHRHGQRLTPAGPCKILGIMIDNPGTPQSYKVGLYSWADTLPGSQLYLSGNVTTSAAGWLTTDISSANIRVNKDFVASMNLNDTVTKTGADNNSSGRGFYFFATDNRWYVWARQLYIRAIIDYENLMDTVKTLYVKNIGTSDRLRVTSVSADQSWVKSIKPDTFSVAPNDSIALEITVSKAGLTTGSHLAKITISSNDPLNAALVNQIKFVVNNGPVGIVSPVADRLNFSLSAFSPNSLHRGALFRYSLVRDSQTRLEIVSAQGRVLAIPVNNFQKAGSYSVNWQAADRHGAGIARGIYFCRLTSASGTLTKRLAIVR